MKKTQLPNYCIMICKLTTEMTKVTDKKQGFYLEKNAFELGTLLCQLLINYKYTIYV